MTSVSVIRYFIQLLTTVVILTYAGCAKTKDLEAPSSYSLDVERTDSIEFPDSDSIKPVFSAVLSSPHPEFGGISGLCADRASGQILALSDRGYFFEMTAQFDEAGKIKAVDLNDIIPVYGNDERATDPRLFDTEALACVNDTVYVAYEQVSRIWAYNRNDLREKPVAIALPPPVLSLWGNTGIESIAVPPDYEKNPGLIVIPEWSGEGNPHRLWWISSDGKTNRHFAELETDNNYMATDAVFGSDGALYVLERKVQFPTGFLMRLRRYDWPDSSLEISEASIIAGKTILEMSSQQGIDNMEALARWQDRLDGSVEFLLASDDNYFWLQNTLIIQLYLKYKY
jgi:hypothetical protein